VDLITLRDVRKTYHLGEIDVPVLKGVTASIARGEMIALMGHSGSGKTTLMNILGCLDRPSSGEYYLDGEEISGMSNDERARVRNKKIGFVFQNFNLLPRTSALEQVMMPLEYTALDMPETKQRARATELLKLVGLGDRLDHEPSQLSGGQQQRIAIARALVNRPPVLLADEPTGNLDRATGERVLAILRELHAEAGTTSVIVTHDPDVAALAERRVHLRDGRIAQIEGGGADEAAVERAAAAGR